jgi:hypothetical protein
MALENHSASYNPTEFATVIISAQIIIRPTAHPTAKGVSALGGRSLKDFGPLAQGYD